MIRRLSFLLLILCFVSCGKKSTDPRSATRAFYFWQTSPDAFPWHDSTYQAMNIKKIYVRFFDVAWNENVHGPVPVAPLDLAYPAKWPNPVPVVFISNETFKNLSVKESEELAKMVSRKINSQIVELQSDYKDNRLYNDDWWKQDPYQKKSSKFDEMAKHDSLHSKKKNNIKEIQFDCDWTKSTKEKYFAFLKASQGYFSDKLITSTVRLYQYKYPKEAGIPPVKRAMLMCYNAGDVKSTETKNSVFDKKEVMSYLEDGKYPIPLDYALPIFNWVLLFHEGKLKQILPFTTIDEYKSNLTQDGDKYVVNSDFVYGYTEKSTLIRAGDEFRVEAADIKDVEEIASWLGDHKNNDEAILSLYHLNTHDFKKYSKEIEIIFNSF